MKGSWLWIGKYLTVIVAAMILGAVLGGLEPFRIAMIGSTRISAGALVQFIAHAGALGLLWALGWRHSAQLRRSGGNAARLAMSVLALATLIVAASAYGVLLHFVAPFLAPDVKPFFDWTFVLVILGSAMWLLWALFVDSEAIIEAIGKAVKRSKPRDTPVDKAQEA